MKLLIFGTGVWYKRYKEIIFEHAHVIGALDNNRALWGKTLDHIRVYDPLVVRKMEYDYVLLLSANAMEMRSQLLEMGVPVTKIMYWEQFRAQIYEGQMTFVGQQEIVLKQEVAIVTSNMNYDGGTFAAIYAAMALRNKGCGVTLCAPEVDAELLDELEEQGLSLAICPEIPYVGDKFKNWIKQFDCVIVNVLQLIRCASEVSQICPTIWWIHESSTKYSNIYSNIKEEFSEFWNKDKINKCKIVGVSQIAKRNFDFYFPNKMKEIMPFGIPDCGVNDNGKGKRVFAVIGTLLPLKAQLIFAEAVKMLSLSRQERCEFWMIGEEVNKEYSRQIKAVSDSVSQIQLKGRYNRKEMEAAYNEISVVVCSSLEETMSITVVEGLMHGKVIITTDSTGIANYITDGVNGYVCKAGDASELATKMEYVIDHMDELDEVRKQARKTYETYFSMGTFGEKLEYLIDSISK